MLTGRAVKWRKTRVDEIKQFRIKDLKDLGVLNKKDIYFKWCKWSRWGKPDGSVCYRMHYDKADEPEFIEFSYTVTNNDTGDKKEFNYLVRLAANDCNFGGKRWWFICPLVKKGVACGRRCSILYVAGNGYYFGCRTCYKLSYESRQRHRQGFYEYFEKPYNRIKQAKKDFMKAKTQDEKLAIWKMIDENKKIIFDYDRKYYKKILQV